MSRFSLLSLSLLFVGACATDEENPSSTETTPTVEFDYVQPGVDTGWPQDTGSTDTDTDTESSDTETSDTETSDTETTDTETSDTETTDTETSDTETSDTETSDTEDTEPDGSDLLADFEDGLETLTGFGGVEGTVVTDPTDSTNTVAEVVKSDSAETWGGVTISYCDNFGITELPFSKTATTISAEVWSPEPGIIMLLKVEASGDGSISVETEATTTAKADWETITWDFSNEASGTAALDLGNTYDKMSFFPNFGTSGKTSGEITMYVDDFTFAEDLDNECPGSDTGADTGS